MTYVVAGDKFIDSQDILKEIVSKFNFKEVKDLTKASKRDDTLIYQILQEEKTLKEQMSLPEIEKGLTKEEMIEELMNAADENIFFIEEIIPDGFISYGYSYFYEADSGEIKSIFVAIDENVGEKKLKDVVKRVLSSID